MPLIREWTTAQQGHTWNLTSSLQGLSHGVKRLSVEVAFEENISLRFSPYEEYIMWPARTELPALLSRIQA